jgi:hypothetical protein
MRATHFDPYNQASYVHEESQLESSPMLDSKPLLLSLHKTRMKHQILFKNHLCSLPFGEPPGLFGFGDGFFCAPFDKSYFGEPLPIMVT